MMFRTATPDQRCVLNAAAASGNASPRAQTRLIPARRLHAAFPPLTRTKRKRMPEKLGVCGNVKSESDKYTFVPDQRHAASVPYEFRIIRRRWSATPGK